jgi:hypothetical protein
MVGPPLLVVAGTNSRDHRHIYNINLVDDTVVGPLVRINNIPDFFEEDTRIFRGDVGPMFAMDGAATIVMTGWPGAEALAGLMVWVTRRIKLTGSLQRTSMRGFIGVKVVGLRA